MTDEAVEPPLIEDSLRVALSELEAYLNLHEDDRLAELTLPFGSRWVLNDTGLDVTRLRDEAEALVKATPLSDRILKNHLGHVTYWVSQRMMLDADETRVPERAAEQLAAARTRPGRAGRPGRGGRLPAGRSGDAHQRHRIVRREAAGRCVVAGDG